MTRRKFLGAAGATAAITAIRGALPAHAADAKQRNLERVVGITTGGLNYQRENNLLTVQTLPAFMRDDLGMQLIDLNTRWLKSFDESYVREVRGIAEDAGCYYTNLKVNHDFGNLYAADVDERARAMAAAQQLVLAAKALGARWIRFAVNRTSLTRDTQPLAHRRIAEFAVPHGVQLIIENNGWMRSDADAVPNLIKAIGRNVAAGPDTGNWDDDVREEGLRRAFPLAVTCDFKVFELDEQKRHARYDIRRCFDIGWKVGFRGPWAIETWNEDTKQYARDTRYLRDQLVKWMAGG